MCIPALVFVRCATSLCVAAIAFRTHVSRFISQVICFSIYALTFTARQSLLLGGKTPDRHRAFRRYLRKKAVVGLAAKWYNIDKEVRV